MSGELHAVVKNTNDLDDVGPDSAIDDHMPPAAAGSRDWEDAQSWSDRVSPETADGMRTRLQGYECIDQQGAITASLCGTECPARLLDNVRKVSLCCGRRSNDP